VGAAAPIQGPLTLVVSWLGADDWVEWPASHGEEAVYVLEGNATVDGRIVPAGGAIVLHEGEPCQVGGPARLAHFSGGEEPRGRAGGRHLLGPGGSFRSGSPSGSQATWFADSTCAGCDVALFRVERDTPGNRGRSHSHSADEILFVVEGTIRLGAHELPAGHAVLIPADTRYAITCGPTKHAFLNYRPTASTQIYDGETEALPEHALGRGGELVGDVLE
jgi:quercetin dioxygenase-like cupin family protein